MNSRQDPGAGPVAGSGNEQALIALLEAARTVEAHLERTLGEIDLTHAKLKVLSHLVEAGEYSQNRNRASGPSYVLSRSGPVPLRLLR